MENEINLIKDHSESVAKVREQTFIKVADNNANSLKDIVKENKVKKVSNYKGISVYVHQSRINDLASDEQEEVIRTAITLLLKREVNIESKVGTETSNLGYFIGYNAFQFKDKWFEVFFTRDTIFVMDYGFRKDYMKKQEQAEKELLATIKTDLFLEMNKEDKKNG